METFTAVCLGLIVVELGALVAAVVVVALKMGHAAQAVEVAAYRVDQEVLSFGESMRSGWMKAVGAAVSAAVGIFRR